MSQIACDYLLISVSSKRSRHSEECGFPGTMKLQKPRSRMAQASLPVLFRRRGASSLLRNFLLAHSTWHFHATCFSFSHSQLRLYCKSCILFQRLFEFKLTFLNINQKVAPCCFKKNYQIYVKVIFLWRWGEEEGQWTFWTHAGFLLQVMKGQWPLISQGTSPPPHLNAMSSLEVAG